MAVQLSGGKGYKAEINVTPLVDVVLVLLIIFMVVTPMLQKSISVELPEAANVAEAKTKHEQVMLAVNAGKQIFFDDKNLGIEELEAAIHDRLLYNPGLEVFVKGDRRLDYSTIRDVMSACRKAGARRVVLATKERKKAQHTPTMDKAALGSAALKNTEQ